MEPITRYIMTHSKGKNQPICGNQIASAFGISGIAVRRMVNDARCKGNPICSNGKGYYIASDRDEVIRTINSLSGRIIGMNNAKAGLERFLEDESIWSDAG